MMGGVYAQKIKIDKKTGLMSLDKTDVAKFSLSKNADGQDVFTFTDLNSDASVTLTVVKLDPSEKDFLEVTSSLSDKTSEMEYELIIFSLSDASLISNLIVKKYKFFTPEGMNKEAIANFLVQENNTHKQAYTEKLANQKLRQEKLDAFSPSHRNDSEVENGKTGELIARIQKGKDIDIACNITDPLGHAIAYVEHDPLNNGTLYLLKTYLKRTFTLKAKDYQSAKWEAIDELIINGYFGNESNSYSVKEKVLKEYAKAKNVTGILSLNDGSTVEGKFEIDFREIMPDGTEPPFVSDGNVLYLGSKTATYLYKDDNDKDKKKAYKEKDMKSFKVTKEDDPNYDEYYCKIEYAHAPEKNGIVSDNSLDLDALASNLLSGGPKKKTTLVYKVADFDKATMYTSSGLMFIANKKDNGEVTELSPSTFKKKLKEMTNDCPSVSNKVDDCQYTRSSILNLIKEYSECK
jgi:hypothetical protein